MTPEAKLIPASFPHQIQVRTAVMTTMIATALNKKIRGATPTPSAGEQDWLARPVEISVEVFMEFYFEPEAIERRFLLSASGTRSIPRSASHRNIVFQIPPDLASRSTIP